MKEVKIYTDGTCSGNPGPGGWAAILQYNNHKKSIQGNNRYTTNNRMELMAVIESLKILKESCQVEIFSDSGYVVKTCSHGWLSVWQNNGWKTKKGDDVKNKDLWEELNNLIVKHNVKFTWVKGHSGDKYNELADKLAKEMIIKSKVD